mmetsp:Transcript_28339/g.43655  ORF Transcript_28339/g.43655 Transcript_28339/m.43655 type:complete len:185 (-) Transcript_28339:96-650(-)
MKQWKMKMALLLGASKFVSNFHTLQVAKVADKDVSQGKENVLIVKDMVIGQGIVLKAAGIVAVVHMIEIEEIEEIIVVEEIVTVIAIVTIDAVVIMGIEIVTTIVIVMEEVVIVAENQDHQEEEEKIEAVMDLILDEEALKEVHLENSREKRESKFGLIPPRVSRIVLFLFSLRFCGFSINSPT